MYCIRGENPTDYLTPPTLGSSGTCNNWVEHICAESEAALASEIVANATTVNSIVDSKASVLNDLLLAGGEYAWWDILFNDVSPVQCSVCVYVY